MSTDKNLICIQQALEDLAGRQGYQSAAVGALERLRGERDRFQAALDDIFLSCFDHGMPCYPGRETILQLIETARKG